MPAPSFHGRRGCAGNDRVACIAVVLGEQNSVPSPLTARPALPSIVALMKAVPVSMSALRLLDVKFSQPPVMSPLCKVSDNGTAYVNPPKFKTPPSTVNGPLPNDGQTVAQFQRPALDRHGGGQIGVAIGQRERAVSRRVACHQARAAVAADRGGQGYVVAKGVQAQRARLQINRVGDRSASLEDQGHRVVRGRVGGGNDIDLHNPKAPGEIVKAPCRSVTPPGKLLPVDVSATSPGPAISRPVLLAPTFIGTRRSV